MEYDDLFRSSGSVDFDVLADEPGLIRRAAEGDDTSMWTLLKAYRPNIGAVVWKFSHHEGADIEEMRAAAILAFIELVHRTADEESWRDAPLGKRLKARLTEAVTTLDYTSRSAMAIPVRSLQRYFEIMKAVEGDIELAYDLAPRKSMKQSTFLAIHASVTRGSVEELLVGDDDAPRDRDFRHVGRHPEDDDLTRVLVEAAFNAVDDREARIIELSFGFTEGDPLPDKEVAYRLHTSRSALQRHRANAIEKMRDALGVGTEQT